MRLLIREPDFLEKYLCHVKFSKINKYYIKQIPTSSDVAFKDSKSVLWRVSQSYGHISKKIRKPWTALLWHKDELETETTSLDDLCPSNVIPKALIPIELSQNLEFFRKKSLEVRRISTYAVGPLPLLMGLFWTG